MSSSPSFAAYVGIDWADQAHAVCLLAADSPAVERSTLAHTAEAINAWAAELHTRFGGRPVAVCLELSRGPLVNALMKHEHLTLFPLNPKQLAKYRQAFVPSGAKDDPNDAELLGRFVREHHTHLRVWRPDDAQTRLLRQLCEDRRDWVDRRTALGNRLQGRLKECYTLALSIAGSQVYGKAFLAMLVKFPAQSELQRASRKQLERWLPGRSSSEAGEPDPRVPLVRAAQPLTTDLGVLTPGRLAVKSLAQALQQCNEAVNDYDRQIADLMAEHPDAELFTSFPGAGPALAPRLLAALGSDRDRFVSAADVQQLSGIAPITVQSGKSHLVRRRIACPHFMRQTFHEFAKCSALVSPWARAYVKMKIDHGASRQAAWRSLAYKWIRIIYRCWKTRQPYDEAKYLASLRANNSPLFDFFPPAPTPTEA